MYDDPAGHGITQAEIVGGCHSVDEHPRLIAPRHGLNIYKIRTQSRVESHKVTARLANMVGHEHLVRATR